MRKKLVNQTSWRGVLGAVVLAMTSGSGVAEVLPGWLKNRVSWSLSGDSTTDPGVYTGAGERLIIGNKKVVVSEGTVLDDVWIFLANDGHLTLKGVRARKLVIQVASASAQLTMERCLVEDCSISFLGSFWGTATDGATPFSVSFPAEGGFVELRDCVMARARLGEPGLLRLQATNCTFYEGEFASNRGMVSNESRKRAFKECRFVNSAIWDPQFFATTDRCHFVKAESPGVSSSRRDRGMTEAVTVSLIWEEGSPAKLPTEAGSRLEFALVESLPGCGASQVHEWIDGALVIGGMDQVKSSFSEAAGAKEFQSRLATTSSPASTSTSSQSPGPAASPNAKMLKRQQTHINGLLVTPLPNGETSGQMSRMNLTAIPGPPTDGPVFNQDVGSMMTGALAEVKKFHELRHQGIPNGYRMEIAFEEKYSDKDGPSAAVACALLLESAITGKEWVKDFAVTGDMNADGAVKPIGGVAAKLRGATQGGCRIVGIPWDNASALQDMLILDGPAPLLKVAVFGLKQFEEAAALASDDREPKLAEALAEFEAFREVLLRDPRSMVPILRSAHSPPRLKSILDKAPHCLSAKYLLAYGQGRVPKTLTLSGSLDAAQSRAQGLVNAIDDDASGTANSLNGDQVGAMIGRLRKLRPLLDSRVWIYSDAVVDYGEVIREVLLNPIRSGARYETFVNTANQKASAARSAYDRLLSDPVIREELGL